MNREILFRGKAINRNKQMEYRTNYRNGEWIYGYYLKERACDGVQHIIVDEDGEYYPINLKSRGQYTGLTDRNGRKIFEGDILVYPCYMNRIVGYICWNKSTAQFNLCILCTMYDNMNRAYIELLSGYVKESTVVGNIHDNSKWLERQTPRKWKKLLNDEVEGATVADNIHDNPELMKGEENNV